MPMPPVSTNSKARSPSFTGAVMRSRVTPAVGSTMAMRRPLNQLNSDDLPTLGRPTIATCGKDMQLILANEMHRSGIRKNSGTGQLSMEPANGEAEDLLVVER